MSPLVVTDRELLDYFLMFFWPFVRIGSALMVVPVFGSRALSARARLILALGLSAVVAPLLPEPPPLETFGADWWLTLSQQIVIGLLMGFVLQLVFEAVVMGGDIVALGMGLSFATLADPLRGVSTGVVGQFFLILATLLFLAIDGHLTLIALVLESFQILPVNAGGVGAASFQMVVGFGSRMFLGAVQIALPAVISLLLVNMSFGVVSRAAPALNPIAVGFPISLTLGFLVLQFTLEPLAIRFSLILSDAWIVMRQVVGG